VRKRGILESVSGLRQLLPEAGDVDAGELIAGLGLGARAPADRPYTVANFVASADGRATIDGRSRGLGDAGDKQIFRALRGVADGLLVGTGTLAAERYGRLVRDPAARRARERRGLAPEPVACVVTRHGELPSDIPLFAEPEARILIFSGAPVDLTGARAEVKVVRADPSELTMTNVLHQLRVTHGVRLLLCEGGPRLFGALLHERVVDELFLTLAPKLALGSGPGITAGLPLAGPAALRLETLLEGGGSLFVRYRIET
jgi:riboflavin biosynthesis pyrimidine reductase